MISLNLGSSIFPTASRHHFQSVLTLFPIGPWTGTWLQTTWCLRRCHNFKHILSINVYIILNTFSFNWLLRFQSWSSVLVVYSKDETWATSCCADQVEQYSYQEQKGSSHLFFPQHLSSERITTTHYESNTLLTSHKVLTSCLHRVRFCGRPLEPACKFQGFAAPPSAPCWLCSCLAEICHIRGEHSLRARCERALGLWIKCPME